MLSLEIRVIFVTTFPSYPQNRIFDGYKNKWMDQEIINGVNITRTWSYISSNQSFIHRAINFLSFSISSFFGGLKAKKPDIIFSYSPPLTLGFSAWLLSKVWNVPWILRVEDLFPDAAIATGVIKNKFLIKCLYLLEKIFYSQATHISVLSAGFKKIIHEKGVHEKKISVIPVWVDDQKIKPLPKGNWFRQKYNLENKFVLMYTGNMGVTSSLEDVVKAAFLMKENDQIYFVMIGEGIKKNYILDFIEKNKLKNILLLPYQPREKYNEVLAAADIGMVTLNNYSSSYSLPSKIFTIMASGRPVLAISTNSSEIASLISEESCGVNVESGVPKLFSESILKIKHDKNRLAYYSENGRQAIKNKFSRDKCTIAFEKLFKEIIING